MSPRNQPVTVNIAKVSVLFLFYFFLLLLFQTQRNVKGTIQ